MKNIILPLLFFSLFVGAEEKQSTEEQSKCVRWWGPPTLVGTRSQSCQNQVTPKNEEIAALKQDEIERQRKIFLFL
ncbi:hypothetical protein Rin_00001320 [Candidatus Regiella insecticola 5.15]|uniref:Uncharacterized protein n=1 Tax=Candidatus Regiella insecticola 5.15 TaxID=1005043 RepID=G2GWJ6_9ENTR|nr:hypothetical protein [Candidatus Regiella insecticola]EGY29896.1 hypothetical protein Rin_00001320 [Candidatus Regiella insecticola 5.15]